jgi:hypothetical protein
MDRDKAMLQNCSKDFDQEDEHWNAKKFHNLPYLQKLIVLMSNFLREV